MTQQASGCCVFHSFADGFDVTTQAGNGIAGRQRYRNQRTKSDNFPTLLHDPSFNKKGVRHAEGGGGEAGPGYRMARAGGKIAIRDRQTVSPTSGSTVDALFSVCSDRRLRRQSPATRPPGVRASGRAAANRSVAWPPAGSIHLAAQKLKRADTLISRPAIGTKSFVKDVCRRAFTSNILLADSNRLTLSRPVGRHSTDALTSV